MGIIGERELSNLKVLLISPLPPPAGGIATWSERYLTWCRENGIHLDIVNNAIIGDRINLNNTQRIFQDEIKRTREIFVNLREKTEKFQPDIVHLNSSCGKFGIIRDYLCALFLKRKSIKVVVHYHCDIEDQLNNKFQRLFFKKLTMLADNIIVLNKKSERFIFDKLGRKTYVLPNFVDDIFLKSNKKLVKEEINNIVFIGHVNFKKGIKEIIEVAHYYPNINFLVAGPISEEVRLLTAPPNINLIGTINQEQVKDLLDKADVFLFPSYTEGFAIALLESMARGVPVIATKVGANADMIEKYGGFLIDVASVESIRKAINQLKSPEIREKMSLWNLRKVNDQYTVQNVLPKITDLYVNTINA